MKKLFLVASLAIASLFINNAALAGNGNGDLPITYCLPPTDDCSELQANGDRCGVTDAECVAYLEGLGYASVVVISYQGCNSICDTSNSYNTKVLITNGIISGYEDMPQ